MRKDIKTGIFIGMTIVFAGWILLALFSDTLQERRQKQLVNEPPVSAPAEPFTSPVTETAPIPPQPARQVTEPVKPAPVQAIQQVHIVQTGETLSSIASQYYGDSAAWKKILEANSDILKNDPIKLRPGMQLKIPAK